MLWHLVSNWFQIKIFLLWTWESGIQVFGIKKVRDIFACTPNSFHNLKMRTLGGGNGRLRDGRAELKISYWFRPNVCSQLIEFGVIFFSFLTSLRLIVIQAGTQALHDNSLFEYGGGGTYDSFNMTRFCCLSCLIISPESLRCQF